MRAALLLAGLVLVTGALYANALGNPFISDDLVIIAANPTVTHPDGAAFARLWVTRYNPGASWDDPTADADELPLGRVYRPVTTASFWLNSVATGVTAPSFRIVNVVGHAFAAWVLALLTASWGGELAGAVAGIVMALHPSATDVVNRVVGRADILALLGVTAFLVIQRRAQRDRWTWSMTAIAMLSVAIALGAKESGAVVLPLAIVQAWLGRDGAARRSWTETVAARRSWMGAVAVLVPVAFYSVGRAVVVGRGGFNSDPAWDLLQNPLLESPLVDRVPAMAALTLDYLRALVYPHPLLAFDVADRRPEWSDATTWAGLVTVASIAIVACVLLTRRHRLALPLWWWLLGFVIVSQLITTLVDYRQIRFVYALVPALALLAGFVVERVKTWGRAPLALVLLIGLLLSGVAARAVVARNRDFRDLRTLLEADVRGRPESAGILLRKADQDANEGRPAEAEAGLARVTELAPWSSQAWRDRAEFYDRRGRLDLARPFFERAVEQNPDNYLALMRLGTLTMDSGDLDGATRLLERAQRIVPQNRFVLYNLAVLDSRRGRNAAAIARLQDLLTRYPAFSLAKEALDVLEQGQPSTTRKSSIDSIMKPR